MRKLIVLGALLGLLGLTGTASANTFTYNFAANGKPAHAICTTVVNSPVHAPFGNPYKWYWNGTFQCDDTFTFTQATARWTCGIYIYDPIRGKRADWSNQCGFPQQIGITNHTVYTWDSGTMPYYSCTGSAISTQQVSAFIRIQYTLTEFDGHEWLPQTTSGTQEYESAQASLICN